MAFGRGGGGFDLQLRELWLCLHDGLLVLQWRTNGTVRRIETYSL